MTEQNRSPEEILNHILAELGSGDIGPRSRGDHGTGSM